MKTSYIREPELEFCDGRHVDVRFGIMNYGPFDRDQPSPAKTIRLGVVGNAESTEAVAHWLEHCAGGIARKDSRQPNLFPRFPGFGEDSPFGSTLLLEPRAQRSIRNSDILQLSKIADHDRLVEESVGLMLSEVRFIAKETNAEVLICAVPGEMLDLLRDSDVEAGGSDTQEGPHPETHRLDFRSVLKARAMKYGKPIQIILPATYGARAKRKRKRPRQQMRILQDEATRAWNFFVALYYKRGGIPWRLPRDVAALTTCYVGIAFYRAVDDERLDTAVAQVFDERGHGLVVRGGAAVIDKEDRTPHLPAADARHIILTALRLYREEHKAYPARIVVHKSSGFTQDEREACIAAAGEIGVENINLLCCRRSLTRLFRRGAYPPLRGTVLHVEQNRHILYSKGSVDFFETYPGMYVPLPLEIEVDTSEDAPNMLIRETLALTKMNWNSTQFDHSEPIPLIAAHQVGEILKNLSGDESVEPRYSFYM